MAGGLKAGQRSESGPIMEIHGEGIFDQPPAAVWPVIFDPARLLGLIPGCQRLEQISPDEYQAEIRIGLAGVSGSYQAVVRIERANPPASCTFSGEVNGPTGAVRGSASLRLAPQDKGTRIEYEARGIVTGALAKLNPRFVEGAVNTLIRQGLARLARELHQQQAV